MIITKNFLIILTGLPASGKTTFARMLKKGLEKKINSHKIKIIDPDEIRTSLSYGKFDPTKEQIVREKNLAKVEKSLKEGYIVISDDLNYYTSMRHDLKNISDDYQ